jgi:tetratricopeptide (TPR) repeat protein
MNSTVIGLFRADITPIDRLLQTAVGRKEMLDDLINKLRAGADKKGVQHYIFIGPRGIGKTHFLSLLENSVNDNKELHDRYTVLRFPEENNRILSFADLLLGIIQLMADDAEDPHWRTLYETQSLNENDQTIIDTIVPRLKKHRKESGKMLLVLMENLDILLTQNIKDKQDIHRFRSFLMDSPSITLIGTSPVYFLGLYDSKSPLYDFFDIQVLEDLSEAQTIDMIRRNLEWEKREEILKEFEKLVPKIKAIHVMTGGNPRLIMMLYELVANDNILDVKVQFQKLLDQISPFYQDRLKDLAPQERALLETIALMRSEPRTPSAIAKRLRKSPQLISSLLQRMTKAGYLTVSENPADKRSSFYRIKEGFFDLWLAMSESRLHKIRLPYLVDFFNVWYWQETEREKKRQELLKSCESPECNDKVKENNLEMLAYLSDVGNEDEKFVSKLEIAVRNLKQGHKNDVAEFMGEIEPWAPIKSVFQWMKQETDKSLTQGADVEIYKWFDDLIEYWKTQRTGDLEKAAEIAQKLGFDLSNHGLHQIRIELLKDALSNSGDPKQQCLLLLNIAEGQNMDGQNVASVESFQKAIEICRKDNNNVYEAIALNNISQIFNTKGDYDTALHYLNQSLTIARNNKYKQGEGASLNNIGLTYTAKGDFAMAMDYINQSLKINREINNKSGEQSSLHNLGEAYFRKKEYDVALEYFNQSLLIAKLINDNRELIPTLHNVAAIYKIKEDFRLFFKYETEASAIAHRFNDAEGIYHTCLSLGKILCETGESVKGLKYLCQAYDVGIKAGFPKIDKLKAIIEKYSKK